MQSSGSGGASTCRSVQPDYKTFCTRAFYMCTATQSVQSTSSEFEGGADLQVSALELALETLPTEHVPARHQLIRIIHLTEAQGAHGLLAPPPALSAPLILEPRFHPPLDPGERRLRPDLKKTLEGKWLGS